jgi:hypothetical protein
MCTAGWVGLGIVVELDGFAVEEVVCFVEVEIGCCLFVVADIRDLAEEVIGTFYEVEAGKIAEVIIGRLAEVGSGKFADMGSEKFAEVGSGKLVEVGTGGMARGNFVGGFDSFGSV